MEPIAPCPPRPNPFRSAGLPVLLSLALHGLLIAGLQLVPAGAVLPAGRSLPIDTCVFANDDFACTLDSPSRGPGAEPPPLAIRVDELPVVGSPPSAAPSQEPGGPASEGAVLPTAGTAEGNPGGQSAGAGSGPSIFQVSGSGRSVVYVIDRSLSMGVSRALPAAQRELRESLERLSEAVCFQVIPYNREAEPLRLDGRAGLMAATADNKRRAAELVDALRAAGPTDHLAALRRALLLRPEVIFFITDAADLTAAQIDALTRQNQGQTAIHAIELSPMRGGPAEEGALALLARRNRGTYRRVCLSDKP